MTTTANTTPAKTESPAVGDGMTLCFPQDYYPYVIVSVSPSGKTVKVKPLKPVSVETGHKPDHFDGPFPVWSHTYTDQERVDLVEAEAAELTVRLTKNGWTSGGSDFAAGGARYRRNYSY